MHLKPTKQLKIETFDNARGGNGLFKALSHPLTARLAPVLLARLKAGGPVAVYDVAGSLEAFAEFYDLAGIEISGVFVQDLGMIGRTILGHAAQPVSDLPVSNLAGTKARTVLVASFDADRPASQMRHLVPAGAQIASFDALRLPPERISNPANYLDPINWATNFAFFRDTGEQRTRLVTANYWAGYGAAAVRLHLILFDEAGAAIAEWSQDCPAGVGSIVLDSGEIRRRFALPEFTGQLFIHVVGARGHDVVKYALDTFGPAAASANPGAGDASLSCTHDANSWPAQFYAGLPAPAAGETVTLWVQNSHPCPIPSGAVGVNLMGDARRIRIDRDVGAFATLAVDVGALMPEARWPQQMEIEAGKFFVRPRYEIVGSGRRRIAHVNVERTDLKPDPHIAELGNLMGKGYLLPAPILPPGTWRTDALPTPMATCQAVLPVAAIVYDGSGREVATHRFGTLKRDHATGLALDDVLAHAKLPAGYGHFELVYDFADGGEADGWLHGLFRYTDRASGHAAETSFGAHIFNTVLTYKNEPQSYHGRPPGLSTRLFLRLGQDGLDTLCHLIYPASTRWHETSSTDLILHDRAGAEVARERVRIACSGSLFWRYGEVFDSRTRTKAGADAYVTIRDTTCRLFGYHGLIGRDGAFSLDHMFGF